MGRGKNKQKQQPQNIHIEELEIENNVEIDYDKLAEAIVKANQLSHGDIRNAVCDGILQAEERREQIAKEKIKNTKLSGWAIARLIFFSIVAVFFVILAICAVVSNVADIAKGITAAGHFSAVAAAYVMLAITDYALEKNKDKNFGFNLISIMLALGSLLVAIFD